MFSKYQGSMLWSPIAVSNHGGADTEVGSHCCKFFSLQVKCPPNLKGQTLFIFFYYPSSLFSLSPLRSQIFRDHAIQKQPPIERSFEFLYMPREECRLKKNLRFTPQSESPHRWCKPWAKGKIWFPELCWNIPISSFQ